MVNTRSQYEIDARKQGVIEPTKLPRETIVFLECENNLLLELIATDPTKQTYTASANFGTLVRPQTVQVLGAVEPGLDRTLIHGIIAKGLRVALQIRGRLKVLPMVQQATIKGKNWSYDLWSDN